MKVGNSRLPMLRGFTNIFKKKFSLVKVETLNQFPQNTQVTPESLWEAGLVKDRKLQVKILGSGDLIKPLTVAAHKFSKSAHEKIVGAGGVVKEL